ncbi:MAG: M23 family metallopeptidase [Cyclobacteriaceae bacterium]|nr:M23 family metallopeptidase [Cyclobacteriaceae bacterium]
MIKPKFHYNPETCQYERARVSWVDWLGYIGGTFTMGAIFFAIISSLSDRLIESEKASALRQENQVLEKHKAVLYKHLHEAELVLGELHERDRELASTLFENILPQVDLSKTRNNNTEILLADASGFQSILESLLSKSSSLAKNSQQQNRYAASSPLIKDIAVLRSIPTLQPLENLQVEKVSSGFGMRINPFHKGIYHHPGIDIVSPRGTSVVATAPGKIQSIKRSDLQAGYGNLIEIDHGNGYITRYAHLENILVKSGQKVSKGMVIGTVGNSGGSIAPHLHYEVLHQGKNDDPVYYLIEGLESVDHQKLVTQSKKQNQSLD